MTHIKFFPRYCQNEHSDDVSTTDHNAFVAHYEHFVLRWAKYSNLEFYLSIFIVICYYISWRACVQNKKIKTATWYITA